MDHFELKDDEFLNAFETRTLVPAAFTHEAHLRLAYLYIKTQGITRAEEIVSQQIIAYVDALGAKDKYHHTLTIAAVKTVHHFISRSPKASFIELLEEFPRLKNQFKDLILSHYSAGIFQNEKAKAVFVEPDLLEY